MQERNEHTTEFLKQFQLQQTFAAKKKAEGNTGLIVFAVVLCLLFPLLIPLVGIGVVVWLLCRNAAKKPGQAKTPQKNAWSLHRKKRAAAEDDLTFHASSTFTPNEDGEIWMSREKQLEQLNVLRDAGLLEPEEYRMKKERIENG